MLQSPFQPASAFAPIHTGLLPEKDNLYTILADLKRTAREYTTAATESKNPQIRRLFTELLDSTLTLQGRLYEQMQLHNMYNASSSALRQELDKQLRQYAQTEQETAMFLEQTLGGAQGSAGTPMQPGFAQPMTPGAQSQFAQPQPHSQPFGGNSFAPLPRHLPYM